MPAIGLLSLQLAEIKRRLSTMGWLSRLTGIAHNKSYFSDLYEHERMLADRIRLDAYHKAIQKYVTDQDVVVDVGTGTGVLALMAAAKNPRKLYAVDHSSQMLEYASLNAQANGVQNIKFVASHTSGFNPDEKVSVIIQEQMASMLFHERMLDTLLELRDRVLKPGGRILPAKYEFYLEPVQLRASERIPFLHEQEIHGIKFPPAEASKKKYYYRSVDPGAVDHLLCEPEPVFTFDLMTLAKSDFPKQFVVKKPIARAGRLDGICSWFKASFDEEIGFATSPSDPKTHWAMPLYRVPVRDFAAGEMFTMSVETPDLSRHLDWTWHLG